MSCSNCFEVDLKQCPATIELTAGLTAATEYFWVIKRNGRIYQKKVTTDITGKLVIDCSDLPDGLLNAYAGAFILEIREGANYLNVVDLELGASTTTDCVLMSFVAIDGDEGINNIIKTTIAA